MLKTKCPLCEKESMSYTSDYDDTPCLCMKYLWDGAIHSGHNTQKHSIPKPKFDKGIEAILDRLSGKI